MKKVNNEKELKDIIELSNELCDKVEDLSCRIMTLKLRMKMERENSLSFKIKSKLYHIKEKVFKKRSIKLFTDLKNFENIIVYRNGLVQALGVDYKIKGKKVVFSCPIEKGELIQIQSRAKDYVSIMTHTYYGG